MKRISCLGVIVTLLITTARAEPPATAPTFTRQEDIVYGRSYGAALTLDVFKPTAKQNGAGLIFVVSGGWFSSHEQVGSPLFASMIEPLVSRGYTVFAVCHACQPKFQIPEIVGNINRSVRFIRMHARDYGVDPDRLGICGASAGGHLSLMQGIAPQPENPDSKDPLDRVSSKVQAVGCFFPPTDFFNYGKEGENALGIGILKNFKGAFDFREVSPQTFTLERITDEKRIEEIGKSISPAYHVTSDDAPTLIIHGDADKFVPIQQAEILMEKLKAANVPCELVVKPGAAHGWPQLTKDVERIADWFDQHLEKGDR